MAASSLSWTPVVYWRLTTGCLTRASCPPVTSLCVCLLHCPMANVIPLLTAVSACSIVLHFCTLFYSVTLLYILTPEDAQPGF